MDYEMLLDFSADIGLSLQESGAEIYRVEESVSRLLRAYGAARGDVFAIPSCLFVGLTTPDGRNLTCQRRIFHRTTDMHRMERLNSLCRALCRETPPLADAAIRLEDVRRASAQYPAYLQLFGYCLTGGAFSLFFGGSWPDGLAGGLCGISIGVCLLVLSRLRTNPFFKTLAAAFVSGVMALALVGLGLGQSVNLVKIGALMALVPGMGVTNCMRDIMAGDFISGLLRMIEAMFIAVAIALGSGMAIALSYVWGWPV